MVSVRMAERRYMLRTTWTPEQAHQFERPLKPRSLLNESVIEMNEFAWQLGWVHSLHSPSLPEIEVLTSQNL